MKHLLIALICVLFLSICSVIALPFVTKTDISIAADESIEYWFILHRASNIEYLYYGIAGDKNNSKHIKTFIVKTGVRDKRPTPLPQKLGYQYWLIDAKERVIENLETEPFFLRLNIPVSEEEPFGPIPYKECDGSASADSDGQCNWELPGYFGLHGVGGDPSKLTSENEGSSGCIRHTDEDITYLYELLDPEKNPVRYYIEDR